MGKIGTGEGAQAYGWGMYFAGKREVAEYYKQTVGNAERQRLQARIDDLVPRQPE